MGRVRAEHAQCPMHVARKLRLRSETTARLRTASRSRQTLMSGASPWAHLAIHGVDVPFRWVNTALLDVNGALRELSSRNASLPCRTVSAYQAPSSVYYMHRAKCTMRTAPFAIIDHEQVVRKSHLLTKPLARLSQRCVS